MRHRFRRYYSNCAGLNLQEYQKIADAIQRPKFGAGLRHVAAIMGLVLYLGRRVQWNLVFFQELHWLWVRVLRTNHRDIVMGVSRQPIPGVVAECLAPFQFP